jgi:hypothetical protein
MPVTRSKIARALAIPWPFAIALVLLTAAALRTLPPVDWEGGDAENYACIAWRLADGERVIGIYSGPPHEPDETIGPRAFAIRPAVTVPASWLLTWLPPVPWVFTAWPLLLGLSEVALAILFGRALWGPRAGLLAALLVACLPLAVSEARALRADLPAAVFLGWGVFALWNGAKAPRTASQIALGTGAGLMVGASWLAKETVALAMPALAMVALLSIRRHGARAALAPVACVLAGVAVLAAEALVYSAKVGDPLFRFHELARNFQQCRENFFYADSPAHGWPEGGYTSAVLTRLVIAGPTQLLFARPTLGIGFLALVAGIALWRRKDPSVVPILAWLVSLGLAFNFGSTSLSEYRPIVPASTYFQPIVLPACLLCGAAASAWSGSRVVRTGFAAIVTIAGLLSLAVNTRDREPMARLRATAATVPDGARVTIDFRGTTAWSYIRRGTPEVGADVVPFETVKQPDAIDYLVVREGTIAFLHDNYLYQPPSWVADLGEDGQTSEVSQIGDIRLFRNRSGGR